MKHIKIVLLFSILGCSSKNNTGPSISLSSIKLESMEGQSIDLNNYKGKTIFINFWATWCRPCLQEMPTIGKALSIIKDENVVFLFATDEETNRILDFKNSHKFNFEYVRVLNATELNILALPTTFIFNEEGDLVFNEMGYRDWSITENLNIILSKPNN